MNRFFTQLMLGCLLLTAAATAQATTAGDFNIVLTAGGNPAVATASPWTDGD